MKSLGFILNPTAGIGGSVGLARANDERLYQSLHGLSRGKIMKVE